MGTAWNLLHGSDSRSSIFFHTSSSSCIWWHIGFLNFWALDTPRSSFFNYALHFQDTLRQVWQMSHAAKEMKPEDCWKGLVREMCCIPAGIGTPWCFDGLYTYELCCKGFDDPSKAAIPGDLSKAFKPNFIEKGTLSPRPQISVDLFIRSWISLS